MAKRGSNTKSSASTDDSGETRREVKFAKGGRATAEDQGKPERGEADPGRDENAPNRLPDTEQNKRAAARRLEEVRQYFLDRQARREVVATTRTPGGQVLDWIPIESQLRAGRLADPPDRGGLSLARLEREPADRYDKVVRPVQLMQFELTRPDIERGPEGTVPVVRRDIDRITTTKSLPFCCRSTGARCSCFPTQAGPSSPSQKTARFTSTPTRRRRSRATAARATSTPGTLLRARRRVLSGPVRLVRGAGSTKQTIETGHQQYRGSLR